MNQAPKHVYVLAEQRAKARSEQDFAMADDLRDQIEDAGWVVRDAGEGFELTPKPSFTVYPTVASVPVPSARTREGTTGGPAAVPTGDAGPGGGGASTGDAGRRDDEGGGRDGKGLPAASFEASHPGGRQAVVGDAARPPGVDDGTAEETGVDSMVASQVLWDSSLATSRMDEGLSVATTVEDHDKAPPTVATVALIVDGHPSDLRKCVDALIAHSDAKILALDLGNVDGAGTALNELVERHPDRIKAWHVAETPHWRGGSAGWGASRNKLLELDTGDVHVAMETSTILDGDAITPLVSAVTGDVVAAGWKGVDPDDGGRDWHEAGPGEVRGLLGYLLAVRRDKALSVGGFPEKARYYRNADLEFSLTLPGKMVVPEKDLPVHQERHRGYHDVDEEYRDRESRRTYERVMERLRSTGR
ncbi:CysS/YqeB C-terminal domain-containing protein [Sphaerisporangium flaviroseum]